MDQNARLTLSGGDGLEDRPDEGEERSPTNARLEQALQRLMALHEGYAGVTDVVACGQAAVPALRRILAHTKSSGIFSRAVARFRRLWPLGPLTP